MNNNSRIYVAGHTGLLGSALMRILKEGGFNNIITRSSEELDLIDQVKTEKFFKEEKPEYVALCAARVGGIIANSTYPAEFIYNNIQIESNVIHYSYKFGAKKLLFLGSSCIYPKNSSQPIKEEYLLTGKPEETSEPYAIAKIAGIKMSQAYRKQYGLNCITILPATLYGPNDSFDLQNSHVLSALLRKFHEAKIKGEGSVTVWGSGSPRREFLYVDDAAAACLFLLENYDAGEIINCGTGEDISVKKLAFLMKEITGFSGRITFDKSKPDGVSRKLLDSAKIKKMGWMPKVSLRNGIEQTYAWYKENTLSKKQG
ncbi:MAG: GDP-L-fucose synthase [Candidatus Omnitrophota bacterium]